MSKILNIKNDKEVIKSLELITKKLHSEGPGDADLIEDITYYKIFHPEEFSHYEEKIIIELGLFYKNTSPTDLLSYILSGIGKRNNELYGEYLTPVQASIRAAIEQEKYVSISAPTSAGKSYSIRDYISKIEGDVVIIVPSRALIAEYIKSLREKFSSSKNVMISSFADIVFTNRKKLKRVFVLTPERARDIFPLKDKLNITLFFFDEAQVSEEKERGITFDAIVRRVKSNFENAKLVFAHPFVANPEAQVIKHSLDAKQSYSHSYPHNTVGKAFVYGHTNGNDYYFSPYVEKGYHIAESVKLDGAFERFAFNGDKSVLIYVSKASLYDGSFKIDFQKHISKFKKINDDRALDIIRKVAELLGANSNEHQSALVNLLKIGVVIHHGSVPLEVRFLVEDFIREGFAKICFATSTLAQGINMPFDIVWLANMRIQAEGEKERALAFKNLIGRSGRLTNLNIFDFGYVYTKKAPLLSSRISLPYEMSETSILEDVANDTDNDMNEFVNSIFSGTFNENYNIPQSRAERFSADDVTYYIRVALNIIFSTENGKNLKGEKNRENRAIVRESFKKLFEVSIGRPLLDGEESIFNNAITILFFIIRGMSFKEIVGLRYSAACRRDEGRIGLAPFMQPASKIPDSKLIHSYSMFKGIKAKDVNYDRVVFDTYDYLDTVISFSLTDAFMGAFRVYYANEGDVNALRMIDLLKYGTTHPVHILLLRYGFSAEDLEIVENYIQTINEREIKFKNIDKIPSEISEKIEWYL